MKSQIRSVLALSAVAGLMVGAAGIAPASASTRTLAPVAGKSAGKMSCTSPHTVGRTRVTANICTTVAPGRASLVGTRVHLTNPDRMPRMATVTLKVTAVSNGRPVWRTQTFKVKLAGKSSVTRTVTLNSGWFRGHVSGTASVNVGGFPSGSVQLSSPTMGY